jgi:hypothetical protein
VNGWSNDQLSLVILNAANQGFSGFFVYSPQPGAGNLIGSWAAVAGTDPYGNTYPAGLNVAASTLTGVTISSGTPGGSQINLIPAANVTFDVTSAIAGFLQAVAQFLTSDVSQVMPGNLGALLLGTGAAAKMTTALTSPVGAGSGAAIMLEAQNDGGTDTPVISLGTITTPDAGVTTIFTPAVTVTPYALLAYGASSGVAIVTKNSGSGNIAIPAGVTVAKGEAWGPGGAGDGGLLAGFGGGSGEYAREDALAVTGGGLVAYVVGTGGAGGGGSGGGGSAASTLAGTVVTVTAHPGLGGDNIPNKGTGSANTVHFDGAAGGGQSSGTGGSGGASSAGPASAGNPGVRATGSQGGAGGAAVTGGGAGGKGGNNGQNGAAGLAPGGGGGGGGSPNHNGGNGANGRVRLTYSTGVPSIMASIASAAGADQFGTAYPAGTVLPGPAQVVNLVSTQAFSISGSAPATTNVNAVTTTTEGNLTSATIKAQDAAAGSVYRLHAFGFGTWGTVQQSLQFRTSFAGADRGDVATVAATALPISAAFEWEACITLVCVGAGAGATWRASLTGCVTETANPILPGTAADNTIPFARGTGATANDIAVTSLADQVLELAAAWGGGPNGSTISKTIGWLEKVA